MNEESHGPITVDELAYSLCLLRAFAQRADQNDQSMHAMVFDLAAESLESNIESMGLLDALHDS